MLNWRKWRFFYVVALLGCVQGLGLTAFALTDLDAPFSGIHAASAGIGPHCRRRYSLGRTPSSQYRTSTAEESHNV
jgi:hypothetical protein